MGAQGKASYGREKERLKLIEIPKMFLPLNCQRESSCKCDGHQCPKSREIPRENSSMAFSEECLLYELCSLIFGFHGIMEVRCVIWSNVSGLERGG
ncbi:hypothetical protein CDAR_234091 [Caerostris darwini]|uniref:Uncharacterized protein n=1 Tax=Caerostris darwini TaxID=1538125 RepID=A0AAV4QJC4_9ARAC|nr:hypothetical protein CDAR_234091 [Caerostris darwini]